MTYSEAIKKLRTKMILTQTEFAALFNVTFGTVNRWESGKYEPTTKVKRKLQPYFEKHGIEVGE
ncbi:MAG: helix-turn-helix transcriptional regulator [Clostridia bacterium]